MEDTVSEHDTAARARSARGTYGQGKPMKELLARSPIAKLGIAIAVVAAVGLVISLIVPWAVTDRVMTADGGAQTRATGWYDYEMEKFMGDQKASSNLFEDDELNYHFVNSANLALSAYVFALIIGSTLVFIGLSGITSELGKKAAAITDCVLGAMLLIPGTMAMTAGMRFLGYNVAHLSETLGTASPDTFIFPSGYFAIIFGGTLIGLGFGTIRRTLGYLSRVSGMLKPSRAAARHPKAPAKDAGGELP